MQSSFYLGVKALSQVEALGATLNPDLNFVQFGKPYATRVLEDKYSPQRIWKDLQHTLAEYWDILRDLPIDLHDFYQKVKAGRYNIPIEHRIHPDGFEPLRNTLNHIANRIAHTMVLSAFLIGSSIFFLAGHRTLGTIGLVIMAIMGIRLLLSIWKRGGF
jgi:ubiquinone biosynthesis protein